jgi:hypothetical protein
MTKDIQQYVRSCHLCQTTKPRHQPPLGRLRPLPIRAQPWSSLSMDHITDLPTSPEGFDRILVFICRLTKMVHLIPRLAVPRNFLSNSCIRTFSAYVAYRRIFTPIMVQCLWRIRFVTTVAFNTCLSLLLFIPLPMVKLNARTRVFRTIAKPSCLCRILDSG